MNCVFKNRNRYRSTRLLGLISEQQVKYWKIGLFNN